MVARIENGEVVTTTTNHSCHPCTYSTHHHPSSSSTLIHPRPFLLPQPLTAHSPPTAPSSINLHLPLPRIVTRCYQAQSPHASSFAPKTHACEDPTWQSLSCYAAFGHLTVVGLRRHYPLRGDSRYVPTAHRPPPTAHRLTAPPPTAHRPPLLTTTTPPPHRPTAPPPHRPTAHHCSPRPPPPHHPTTPLPPHQGPTAPIEMRKLIGAYLDRFCAKPCCFMDLQPYLGQWRRGYTVTACVDFL